MDNFLNQIVEKDKTLLLLRFQNSLKSLLNEYIHTPNIFLLRKSKSISIFFKYYSALSSSEVSEKALEINKIPEFISLGYRLLEEKISFAKESGRLRNTKIYLTEQNRFESIENKWIKGFDSFINNELKSYLMYAFVHGSCADGTTNEFSDFDTFLVINRDTLLDIKLLKSFRKKYRKSLKFLYGFDPLQHHNHMFCTEIDLTFFPYNWLPPQILKDAKVLLGNNVLNIDVYRSIFLMYEHFLILTNRFTKREIENKKYTLYSLKNDLSVIYLFPVLCAQILGQDLNKKESFLIDNIKNAEVYTFYEEISVIRSEWKIGDTQRFMFQLLNNYIGRRIYLKLFKTIKNYDFVIKDSVLNRMFLKDLRSSIDWFNNRIVNEFAK